MAATDFDYPVPLLTADHFYGDTGDGVQRTNFRQHFVELILDAGAEVTIEVSGDGVHWFPFDVEKTTSGYLEMPHFYPNIRARRTDVDPAVAQVETATAAGTITGAGHATVIVTGALVAGSPLTVSVAVANADTAAVWAGKVRAALAALPAITTNYVVGGAGALITLTAKAAAANDATLNIDLDNGDSTGITTAHSSANTTPGVAPGTAVALVNLYSGIHLIR